MRWMLSFILSVGVFVIIPPNQNQSESNSILQRVVKVSATGKADVSEPCLSDSEISAALQKVSMAQTYEEQSEALTHLRNNANRSQLCRKQIITALMTAMNKPNLDLLFAQSDFYLWHYGTRLLSDLKAVEALDLLIAHMDLNDGTEFPLNHHPALAGLIDMGEVAIPKLDAVLRQNPDRYMRRYAVFCLASIGGPSAKQVLRQALDSESDQCVAVFIKASLNAFNNKTLPNHVISKNRTKWYAKFLCKGQ